MTTPSHEPEHVTASPTAPTNVAMLRRFWGYARADARWFLGGLLAVPLTSAAGLAQPWLVKEAIDGPIQRALDPSLASGRGWSLTTVALLFLLAAVAEFAFRGSQLYALQRVGYRALQRLRAAIYRHVMGQGLGFFDRRARGSLLSRSTNDVEALGEVLGFGIVGVIGDVVTILSIVGAMLWLDVQLTLVSLIVSPLIVLVVNFFRRRLRHYSVEIRRANAAATGHFSEALAGHRVVQLHGREAQTLAEYKALNHRYLAAYHRSNWYDASLYAIMDGVAGICIALLIWYGSGRYLDGLVSLGLLVAFIQYIQRLFVPVRELSGKVATLERAMASLERIFELLDVDEHLPEGEHAPEKVAGDVALRGLSFRYHSEAPEVLHGLDLTIAAGEVVALVGPTGSGKSTIGKLLTRMYATPPGALLVDGVPVEQWRLERLREAVGVVQQDVVIFSGTVRDNVTLGRAGIDDDAVQRALDGARLTERVRRLGGLDAQLSDSGGNLSAGERQLLSIARVLALDPPMVILDEATANIDSLTERDVQAAMDAVFEGRTVLVVAHRLSTIRKADRIVVLEAGRIVEQGDHDTLLATGGLYSHLVERGQLLTADPETAGHEPDGVQPERT